MAYMDVKKTIGIPDKKFVYTMDGLLTMNITLIGLETDNNKVIKAGTILGRITNSGYYNIYDNTASDGREVPVGVLLHDVTISDGELIPAEMVIQGALIKELLIGYDETVKSTLAVSEIPVDDETTIALVRSGSAT